MGERQPSIRIHRYEANSSVASVLGHYDPAYSHDILVVFCVAGVSKWSRDRLFHNRDESNNKLEKSLTLRSIKGAEGMILARGRRETLMKKAGSSIRHTWR